MKNQELPLIFERTSKQPKKTYIRRKAKKGTQQPQDDTSVGNADEVVLGDGEDMRGGAIPTIFWLRSRTGQG